MLSTPITRSKKTQISYCLKSFMNNDLYIQLENKCVNKINAKNLRDIGVKINKDIRYNKIIFEVEIDDKRLESIRIIDNNAFPISVRIKDKMINTKSISFFLDTKLYIDNLFDSDSNTNTADERDCCFHFEIRKNTNLLSDIIDTDNIQKKKRKRDDTDEPIETCVICIDKVKDTASLNSCCHKFCKKCILHWSKSSTACPMCKKIFKEIRLSDTKKNIKVKPKVYDVGYDEFYYSNDVSVDDNLSNSTDHFDRICCVCEDELDEYMDIYRCGECTSLVVIHEFCKDDNYYNKQCYSCFKNDDKDSDDISDEDKDSDDISDEDKDSGEEIRACIKCSDPVLLNEYCDSGLDDLCFTCMNEYST